jgi:hypothetical protein
MIPLLCLAAGLAAGESTRSGSLILSLSGHLSPLDLPRDRPAPVTVRLEGGLRSADGELLPRVRRVELGLPGQGVLTTRGLPVCPGRRLHDTRPAEALAACGSALIGHGSITAEVALPNQLPFQLRTRLLAFNGRANGRPEVLLHAFATRPPIVAVLPFVIERRGGRFGTVLVGDLPAHLGPWPRLANFALTLSRRFSYRGRLRSYLSASCPAPRRFTEGFFSFAKATYTLAGGRRASTEIARNCHTR